MEIDRKLIRQGLELLGPERVRQSVEAGSLDIVNLFGENNYRNSRAFCNCFLGQAVGFNPKNESINDILYDLNISRENGNWKKLYAISSAHCYTAPELKEEVILYLAENGVAIESTIKQVELVDTPI